MSMGDRPEAIMGNRKAYIYSITERRHIVIKPLLRYYIIYINDILILDLGKSFVSKTVREETLVCYRLRTKCIHIFYRSFTLFLRIELWY